MALEGQSVKVTNESVYKVSNDAAIHLTAYHRADVRSVHGSSKGCQPCSPPTQLQSKIIPTPVLADEIVTTSVQGELFVTQGATGGAAIALLRRYCQQRRANETISPLDAVAVAFRERCLKE